MGTNSDCSNAIEQFGMMKEPMWLGVVTVIPVHSSYREYFLYLKLWLYLLARVPTKYNTIS